MQARVRQFARDETADFQMPQFYPDPGNYDEPEKDPRWTTNSIAIGSLVAGVFAALTGMMCTPAMAIAISAAIVVLHRSREKGERTMAWWGLALGTLGGLLMLIVFYGVATLIAIGRR